MAVPLILSEVPDVTPYIQYVATSGQTVFPYPFPITQDSDLIVVYNGTTLQTDAGYTLSGQGDDTGGNVTFTAGATVGDIITLYRDIQIERISQISQNSGFSSTVFNAEFNNIYLIMQQLEASIAQALQIPNTNNPAPTTSLAPADYANKYLAFDQYGNPEPAVLTNSGTLTGSILAEILSTYTAQAVLPPNVRTAAEIAASVVPASYAYPELDIRRYGGDPTGGTASDTALANAILVAKQISGGTIYFCAGTFLFNDQINLNQASGIILQGVGKATPGAGPGTQLTYAGTGSSNWILWTSAYGCALRGLCLTASSSSFTGAMIECSNDGSHDDSAMCCVADVLFNATAYCYHLSLDKCIEFSAERCNFAGGATSVKGQNSAGSSYSNVVSFRDCQWAGCQTTPVNFGGECWSFDSCTFEALSGGAAGAFVQTANTPSNGLSFRNCWFGDATAGGQWVTVFGLGFVFHGNRVSTNTSSYGVDLNNAKGFSIKGNVFTDLAIGVNFDTTGTNGGDISGNYFDPSVTSQFGNLANAGTQIVFNPNYPLAGANVVDTSNPGWEISPNGTLRQDGSASFTASAGVFSGSINFPRAFSALPRSIIVSTFTQDGDAGAVWVTSSSDTAFNVKGTAATSTENVSVMWQAVGLP